MKQNVYSFIYLLFINLINAATRMCDRQVVQISLFSEYQLPFPWTGNADGCKLTVAVNDK